MLAEDQAMQSKSVGEHDPEVVFRDGVAYFRYVPSAQERTSMPRDLIRAPPEWVQALVGKSASVSEFLVVLGARARDARTMDQRKELFTVFEQFALWREGRDAADLILGPDFAYKLTLDYEPHVAAPAGLRDPAIIVSPADVPVIFPGANPGVWLNPWQDEFVWPEKELQSRHIDRRISQVWLNNWRPFVELFLFDGPDLRGRMARFARVWTPNADLPIELDEQSLRGQARSLLGGEFNTSGRRFSASARLTQAAEQCFASAVAASAYGTATLTRAPQFSWDGYDDWLRESGNHVDKRAALRVRWDFQIDDIDYGITVGTITAENSFWCPGYLSPIQWAGTLITNDVPNPWRGGSHGVPPPDRWGVLLNYAVGLKFNRQLEGLLLDLAGSPPNSMLVLPGQSTAIPQVPQHDLREVGQTTDDATIVFFP
ncbi:hypothetical protein [Bradyrhizobium japonicum]|uniref:hypothetical protein n=1 Tax=Bradyrhizobium japonicum TaxID=375 RepID=UPI00057E57CF|nr:hypothetical protein [Bradyrhizobium japonicum]MCD9112991.1 hypothetical protein [Bradyrhizobium japonicum]MCD9260484.1 hypothetical protein [Bradyrhizobium japonicum SEMIA 5079]MCD9824909.1 hypothetical protein [Bradyrhizobium japonicum]MCD9897812.1 hypothetical protein [Bradyrhizobium japonicum]MCD9912909.1 hypothetical protein [Bradyrhizobium japonicum]